MTGDDLRAVIFDVDGTLAETERDGHRVAFNRAFADAGLSDRWDEDRYGQLLLTAGGRQRLHRYFVESGRTEDEAATLASRVHTAKTAIFRDMIVTGALTPRPGVTRLLDDLAAVGITLAVATTGSREWVGPFLDRLLERASRARFEVVVTGDDVAARKPDPEAYALALARLSVTSRDAVAVEDSANGVRAAAGAGVVCVAVPGDYSAPEDVVGAGLVLAAFGEPGAPAVVLHDPHGVAPGGVLDARALCALRAASAGDLLR